MRSCQSLDEGLPAGRESAFLVLSLGWQFPRPMAGIDPSKLAELTSKERSRHPESTG
jgi:hypothetical protein